MPIEIYSNIVSPPVRAVLITAKHLAIPIQIHDVDLMGGGTKTTEYLKLNPNHTVPALVDDDGKFVLFESRAIMTYLANRYGPNDNDSIYPKDPRARAQVDKVLYYDAATLFPSLKTAFVSFIIIDVSKCTISNKNNIYRYQYFFNNKQHQNRR